MPSIIHFTTVHSRTDTRIRVKQVSTLAAAFGQNVELFVQDGCGDEIDATSGFRIHDTGLRPQRRISRMTKGAWRMFQEIRKARPQIAHFHDPELIPVGILLRLTGVKIIYDVHEDLPRQILAKSYLSNSVRKILSLAASSLEWLAAISMNHIVLAGATLSHRFPSKKSTCIYNYPMVDELTVNALEREDSNSKQFFYVGGLAKTRGVVEMVQAIDHVTDHEASLSLAGPFQPKELKDEVTREPGWKRTAHVDWIGRKDLAVALANSAAGLVTLQPTDSYLQSYPTKLFEYMMGGLPIIASDFPFWRTILDDIDCAIFVDPLKPQEIARAMHWILDNPDKARKMGEVGKNAVKERFSWDIEARRLVELYEDLLAA
ncbi:MAG: glycosyltransferase [Parasphingorhabdus sp.]|uniref:glycosyltransferase n=1 Tax=Parasphingorhabdus sp. TaxID=2709688 RepID=UPI00329A4C3E